jgi:hypothetical protein
MNNAIIIYDNFPETFPDLYYKNKIQEITDFYISNCPSNFKIFKTKDIDDLLSTLKKYDWIFINLLGHCVHQPIAYNEIITECENQNCDLMAHIVCYPNQFPQIDNQFVAIRWKTWNMLGNPKFTEINLPLNFSSKSYERSIENFHDDYTPYWIKPLNENKNYSVYKQSFGFNVVRSFLENRLSIGNFNHAIRNKKWNLYAIPNYETNSIFFLEERLPNPIPDVFQSILNEKNSLKDTIYILNSEEFYKNKKFDVPIDTYVGVASGFKHLLLLNWLGFTPNTHIIFTDISNAALDYQRYLIENWDGKLENYYQISKNYQEKFTNLKYAWRNWNGWDNEINMFLSQANMSKEEFAELWEKYCNLKHTFIELNLLENTKSLTNLLSSKNNENIYIWLSNAFKMQWTVFFLNQSDVEQNFNNLLDDLKNTTNHYIVEANQFYTVN